MNINHGDPVTWLNALWEVISDWEDRYEVYPEDIDDVKTVMAWIAGALGYDIDPETGEYVLEEEIIVTDKQIDYEANLNVKAYECTEKLLQDIEGHIKDLEHDYVAMHRDELEDLRVEVLNLRTLVRHQ